ncbi:FkbM family methyltransferase [Acidisoma cellulosilytica]|uniref:FkbM family methyltransferase n=1 Tax=Acidisoma cellulosilyticum TaxID=2802395 RepID=A0A964E629_9PROT|nr:FkbM family methyltransferase [Acidisoma cellulosilyticum]MCB8883169.1 FkbM family methyltransferase [Acidisoma cellulosilyticum]
MLLGTIRRVPGKVPLRPCMGSRTSAIWPGLGPPRSPSHGRLVVTFVSYAQNFEDVMLWRALSGVERGFYIDVGAAHPDIDSVTRAFYDRGWTGLNIEPTAEYSLRLTAARPRDRNLRLAVGEHPGRATFFVVDGTGLSTLDASAVASLQAAGMEVRRDEVEVATLRDLWLQYAPAEVHFLKIDVEGAERAVLAGADFHKCRPWIVIVEATAPMSTVETHKDWEPLLLQNGYGFVWFDGLNRFYVADERRDQLAPAFRTPPNVFDDFIRAGDSEWARRIHQAETRVTALQERAVLAETRIEREVAAAETQIKRRDVEIVNLRASLRAEEQKLAAAQAAAEAAEAAAATAQGQAIAQSNRAESDSERASIYQRREAEARAAFEAIRSSTSWRVTAPLRKLRSKAASPGPVLSEPLAVLPPAVLALPHEPAVALPITLPALPPPPPQSFLGQNRRVVHQFHSGSAVGDAITNAMFLTRRHLRAMGYESDIFVEHRDVNLAAELRLMAELPIHDRYVLIVRYSMGFDAFGQIASLAAPKILLYHNITPPQFFEGIPSLQHYTALGRAQLPEWRSRVVTSLADSDYNAIELRNLGFDPVQTCNLLLDIDAIAARAALHKAPKGDIFTILFVGRVCASKAQADLVEVYAAFRARFAKPSRLVIVGRHGGVEDAYVTDVKARIAAHGMTDDVLLTGLISDEERDRWYAAADVYLSMSLHEGFGVPLAEAMVFDLPVLARPAGAVPYTLCGTAGLLEDDSADAVATRLIDLAEDTDCRRNMLARQQLALRQFALDQQKPALLQALAAAGAAPPAVPEARTLLLANANFVVTGHVNGSYSLASINRGLALTLEEAKGGSVRLLPVEGAPTDGLTQVPAAEMVALTDLMRRPKSGTGPEIVISQHYPVFVPPDAGDLLLALFFWEESVIPAATIAVLNASFRGVLAPSHFVAKVLLDSGLTIPLRVVGYAPRLDSFRAIGAAHAVRDAGPFTFLHVSSGFPRKGVDVLLASYADAFQAQDNVHLIIKTFPNPHNEVASQIADLQAANPDLAQITLLDRDMDETDLLELYRSANAMVLPTRGEGFNLPAAEAIAAGLPVIVTGFGGHMDFCGADRARLIDYRFDRSGSHLAKSGSVWAEPDASDLTQALQEAFRKGPVAAKAAALDDTDAFARRVASASVDILMNPPPPPMRLGWMSSYDVRCGIAEYSRHLIEALPASDRIGSVTIFADKRTSAQSLTDNGHKVMASWTLGLPDGIRPIEHAIASDDPHVLVIQHQPGLFQWQELAKLVSSAALRARIVVLVLHSTTRIWDIPEELRPPVIAALNSIARVIVHTLDDLNQLKKLGLIENVTLLAHGARVPESEPTPARAITRSSFPVIGCYGFFLPDKGIPQLIEAIALLRSEYPSIRLRLVNADYGIPESAAQIALCRALAESKGLADAVEFHTDFLPHAESLSLLAGCDVVALPYQTSKEASSAALRTALGAGAPVVVTPLGLFNEAASAVARLGGTDTASIAEGIGLLLEDQERRGALKRDARTWLEERAWPSVALKFQNMLLGLHVQKQIQTG